MLLRNLLGDPNVVRIHLENGEPFFTLEVEGDVLPDVEFNPKNPEERFPNLAESAVKKSLITACQRKAILESDRASPHRYTYYEN